jgi:hypothetical protein
MKIPVFLPVTREFGFRDEFARDSLLQRRDGMGQAAKEMAPSSLANN